MKLTRVALYIDGGFFHHAIQNLEENSSKKVDYGKLFSYISRRIDNTTSDINEPPAVISSGHMFRGAVPNPSDSYLQRHYQFMEVLRRHNVETHLLSKGNYSNAEKGVDVSLAIEALAGAFRKEYDVLALIAGDQDFVPLVRKLETFGVFTVLVGYNSSSEDVAKGKTTTFTSGMLCASSRLNIMLNELPSDLDIFRDDTTSEQVSPSSVLSEEILAYESSVRNKPHLLKPWESIGVVDRMGPMFGFLKPEDGSYDSLFFSTAHLGESVFDSLCPGVKVIYSLGSNTKGVCANVSGIYQD